MTPLTLCADEVYALLDLDPSVETDARDIDAVRAIVARMPARPVVSVFGPVLEGEAPLGRRRGPLRLVP